VSRSDSSSDSTINTEPRASRSFRLSSSRTSTRIRTSKPFGATPSAIRRAETIALVGFSFTPTDLHVESLFRIALAKSNLRTLIIANPSVVDHRRTRPVFALPLESGCVVRQYDDLSDFAKYLAAHSI
jgi:hypothetical protein